MNTCQGCQNRLSFMSYYLRECLKLYVSQIRKLSQYLLLTVNVNSQRLASILTSKVSLQDSLQCLRSTLLGTQWQYFYLKKGKLVKINTPVTLCHLLSLVVIRCTTRCHSLYHSLSLVEPLVVIRCHLFSSVVTRCTTRCHSLSPVVTGCITRLSFYKRSCTSFL